MSNMVRNCTAVFTSSDCEPRGWVAIPCQKKIHTSVVCMKKQTRSIASILNDTRRGASLDLNKLSCGKGWVLVGQKCLYFITFNVSVSFNEAQYECASYGSKLLSVEKVESPYPYQDNLNVGQFGFNFQGINASLQTRLLVGIPFSGNFNYYIDTVIHIMFLFHARAVAFPIIEVNTNACWIVQSGITLGIKIYTPNGLVKGNYRMRRRLCSAPIKWSAFICEKQLSILNMTCGLHEFRCEDDSCILVVYLCDGVYDCPTKEDEAECPLMDYNTDGIVTIHSNNTEMIPCIKRDANTTVRMDRQLITYAHVHSVCDGRHVCDIVSEDQCTYETMIYISYSHHGELDANYKNANVGKSEQFLTKTLMEEIKHYKLIQKGSANYNETEHKKYEVTNLQLLCNENNIYYNFTSYCYIEDMHRCTYGKYSLSCSALLCPGMFKCIQSFCIRLSSVCDGHIDCPESEDEINCSNMSCNGFLKCRNENRCVGLQQICDGVVDCHYSYDDELYCVECPAYCNCTGYTTRCTGLHADTYRLIVASYAKAIIFKANIRHLSFQDVLSKALVYIDLSACEIRSISNKHYNHDNRFKHILNLLHANFSNNFIQNDVMLTSREFNKLIILDFSNNLFTFLGSRTLKYLYNLKILKFDQNPISRLELNAYSYITKLNILSIKNVYLKEHIFIGKIQIYLNFTIVVDEMLFCCHFHKHIKDCVVKINVVSNYVCNGLIHSTVQQLIFKCLTALSFVLSTLFTGYHVYCISSQGRHNYLFLIFMNIGVSEIQLSVYLVCLAIADDINVDVVVWQKSLYCISLHAFLTVSLAANIILKVISSYVLLLKIIYPFKHQCRYVRMSWLICLLIWIILTVSYVLYLLATDITLHLLFSAFCTVWCTHSDFAYFNIFIAILELIAIGSITLCVPIVYVRLKRSAAMFKTTMHSNRSLNISLPFLLELLGDVFLRFPIITIVIINILEVRKLNTSCISVIMYLLPFKIMVCSSSRIICKLLTK